jgi:hypothetical protein
MCIVTTRTGHVDLGDCFTVYADRYRASGEQSHVPYVHAEEAAEPKTLQSLPAARLDSEAGGHSLHRVRERLEGHRSDKVSQGPLLW